MPETTIHKQVYECVACDEFEFKQRYTGSLDTPGRDEYDRITPPTVCPVCGGRVDLVDEVIQ